MIPIPFLILSRSTSRFPESVSEYVSEARDDNHRKLYVQSRGVGAATTFTAKAQTNWAHSNENMVNESSAKEKECGGVPQGGQSPENGQTAVKERCWKK